MAEVVRPQHRSPPSGDDADTQLIQRHFCPAFAGERGADDRADSGPDGCCISYLPSDFACRARKLSAGTDCGQGHETTHKRSAYDSAISCAQFSSPNHFEPSDDIDRQATKIQEQRVTGPRDNCCHVRSIGPGPDTTCIRRTRFPVRHPHSVTHFDGRRCLRCNAGEWGMRTWRPRCDIRILVPEHLRAVVAESEPDGTAASA